jgi:fatty acid-binding protein DegV
MIEQMMTDKDKIDLKYIMVTHSLAHQQASFMMRIITQAINPKQIIESHAGCVITIHSGIGTIGLTYIVKE